MPLALCLICLEWNHCKYCSICYGPWYCGSECQTTHWCYHKKECFGWQIREFLRHCKLPDTVSLLILRFALKPSKDIRRLIQSWHKHAVERLCLDTQLWSTKLPCNRQATFKVFGGCSTTVGDRCQTSSDDNVAMLFTSEKNTLSSYLHQEHHQQHHHHHHQYVFTFFHQKASANNLLPLQPLSSNGSSGKSLHLQDKTSLFQDDYRMVNQSCLADWSHGQSEPSGRLHRWTSSIPESEDFMAICFPPVLTK